MHGTAAVRSEDRQSVNPYGALDGAAPRRVAANAVRPSSYRCHVRFGRRRTLHHVPFHELQIQDKGCVEARARSRKSVSFMAAPCPWLGDSTTDRSALDRRIEAVSAGAVGLLVCCVYPMASKTESEVLTVAGREVAISNPRKVLFPQAGLHQARSRALLPRRRRRRAARRRRTAQRARALSERHRRRVLLSEARAARRGRRGSTSSRCSFPSGRTAEEVVPRDAAALAWMANLACLELHPHPVRADDLDHPDELRVDLDPVPGVDVAAGARGRARRPRDARRLRPGRLAEDVGLARHARLRAHRAALDVRRGAPRRAGASRAKSSGARRRSRRASGGRKSATACSSTTTRTRRTARLPARTRCGRRPTRACPRR